MTCGHELRWENVGGRAYAGWRGIKRGNWGNCNSIINKMYLKIILVDLINNYTTVGVLQKDVWARIHHNFVYSINNLG